jgi:hypothetical protein
MPKLTLKQPRLSMKNTMKRSTKIIRRQGNTLIQTRMESIMINQVLKVGTNRPKLQSIQLGKALSLAILKTLI